MALVGAFVVVGGQSVCGQSNSPVISPYETRVDPAGSGGRHRTPALKPEPKLAVDPRLARLDSSTRMVVELELRDAPAAEREQWLNMISSVDPSQVGYLLEARRRSVGSTSVSHSTPAAAPSPVMASGHASEGGHAIRMASHAAPAALGASHLTALPSTPSAASSLSPYSPSGMTSTEPVRPAPVEPPESVPAYRRLLNPLRGRWGEGRQDETEANTAAVAPVLQNSPPAVPATDLRSSAYMNVELQRVMTLLRSELVDAEKSGLSPSDPAYRRMHLQMKLLHLLADEPEQALQAIPNLSSEQQEFWIQLLWALSNELEIQPGRTEAERLRRTGELLNLAQQQLRQASPLNITTACFCHRIHSFGSYDRFGQDEFRPGQPVLLYAEVTNFLSELTADNIYRTRIHSQVEIFPADASGQVAPGIRAIDRRDFPVAEDLCRSPRRDYFHSHRIDLPSQLPAGPYVLRLSLSDVLGQKTASTDLPFLVR
ncbi:MAG: hypothetical protein ACK5Q5_23230 [Planctomycetaceae bacterium]